MNAPPPNQYPIPGDDLGLAVPDEPDFEAPQKIGPPPVDGGPPPGYATEVVLVDDDDS